MGRLDRLYPKLPVWLQHGAVTAYGAYWYWLRFGPGFNRYVKEYKERERFSPEEWLAWQEIHISKLLQAAVYQIPYYQQSWSQKEKAAALAGRLKELPLLEKAPIRAHPEAFLRQDMQPGKRL